jgi:hypothetical protein
MDYSVLLVPPADAGIIDAYPDGSPPGWKFKVGTSLAGQFPKKAWVRFSRQFADGRKLYDFQPNILEVPIVSPKVRRILDGAGVDNVEYLAVQVKDHKSKVIGSDYSIVNLLRPEEAIDMARSKVTVDPILPEQIGLLEKLALDRKKIDPEARLFRCKTMRTVILVRDDVREALEKGGVTGFRTFPADGWDGREF